MKPINTNLEKYRPRPSKKSGQPRNEREQLVEDFLTRLNEDRKRDGVRGDLPRGKLLKAFTGLNEQELYILFRECSVPGIEKFGGFLKHKLKERGVTL